MDNELKRRTFLTVLVGTLLGTPVAVRLFFGGKRERSPHHFTQELQRLQSRVNLLVRPIEEPVSRTLQLTPPIGQSWSYVIFAPSFLPKEFSHALGDEPDMFLSKEGSIAVHQTNKGQVVLSGGDQHADIVSPVHTEEREKNEILLLVRDGVLRQAEPKGAKIVQPDTQFLHLLSLPGVPKELPIGTKWKSNSGRVKPFQNCPTEYVIAGFAEVAGRKTAQIHFKGNIPNIARLPGVHFGETDKSATMTNTHEGKAWFDLESGFLVRQETKMTTVCRAKELATRNGDSLTIRADYIVQLFPA